MTDVISVRFRSGCKEYYFDPKGLTIPAGTDVIVETAQGPEFAHCAAGNHQVPDDAVVKPLRSVLRIATDNDKHTAAYNRSREKEAFDVCKKKIQQHKLEMKLVRVECSFDGSKILFFFTADGRVDFRELVKDLASVFRTRIELRQIGVRDKAKMVGGLGVCGRPFCCKQFLDDFQPVSIKMAKTQNLSLNPTKISGVCGRLMCCLKYEQDAYEDLLRTTPKNESFVDTPDGRGTVTEVNLLRQSVKVRMEDHPETIGCYKNCDICVLRSGKARKNDPPIPKDLAPISSRPRPARKKEEEEMETLPELIFSGAYAELNDFTPRSEPVPETPQTPPADEREAPRRSRRRRGGKGRGGQKQPAAGGEQKAPEQKPAAPKEPRPEKRQPQPKPAAPAESAPEGEAKPRSGNRRRRYRSRRPNGGQGGPAGGTPNTGE